MLFCLLPKHGPEAPGRIEEIVVILEKIHPIWINLFFYCYKLLKSICTYHWKLSVYLPR